MNCTRSGPHANDLDSRYIRVGNRDVRNNQLGEQKLLKYVGTNVARFVFLKRLLFTQAAGTCARFATHTYFAKLSRRS